MKTRWEVTYIILCCIVALMSFLFVITSVFQKSGRLSEERREARISVIYSGWCKETGNPKGLTKSEFSALHVAQDGWGNLSVKP